MSEPACDRSDEPVHVLPVRIYFEDTDAAGIVYHANYLKYAERARTEFIRTLGIENGALKDGLGIAFAVRQCSADFLAPARLDDLLEVHSWVTEVRGASMSALQKIRRANSDLVELRIRLACVKVAGGPARIPAPVRVVLEKLSNGKGIRK